MGYIVASGPTYVSLSSSIDTCPADATLNDRITVKVAPSIATSFFTYELVKDLLIAS